MGRMQKDIVLWVISSILLIVFIASQIRTGKTVKLDIVQSAEELKMAMQADDQMQSESIMQFKKRYGLNPEDYNAIVYYGPVTNMNVEELLLVEMKETSQKDTLQKAMEDRIEYQKTNFDGYGTNQMGILEQAEISFRGNYAMLVIGEGSNAVKEKWNQLEGKENGI